MTEAESIALTQIPATVESIRSDLIALGVEPGMTLIMHASLSSIGWVCGGPVAVIQAVERTITKRGTLVMATQTSDLCDPSHWRDPPVPENWWATIRTKMPPYQADLTPTRGMGWISECFRKQRGVHRSAHPQTSFAAWGRKAERITNDHSLDLRLGKRSPLQKIYNLRGYVLLVGVGNESNTSLHLAEYHANYSSKKFTKWEAPVLVKGKRKWVEFKDIVTSSTDFVAIGEHFRRDTGLVKEGKVGLARALLMPQKPLVDYAALWMGRNRKQISANHASP
jgi:aminoglycoside 3-N-acetyltransferase